MNASKSPVIVVGSYPMPVWLQALGIGVIDIKSNLVESAVLIAMRIEEATRKLGPERVQWAHPDCGFWMLPRSVADCKRSNWRPEEIFMRDDRELTCD